VGKKSTLTSSREVFFLLPFPDDVTILMLVKVVQTLKNVRQSFFLSKKSSFDRLEFFLGPPRKPKDDETIVKYVLRSVVSKVARRLAPRNRQKNQNNNKDADANNDNQQQENQENNGVDQSQPRQPRRGRGRGGRQGGYFIEQGKIKLQ
jgi:hypothetical protein